MASPRGELVGQAKDLLLASAILGRQVAALLNTEAPVVGVTAGKVRDDLKRIALFQRVDGKPVTFPPAGNSKKGRDHAFVRGEQY